MPYCKKCGNKLDNETEFCPKCGTPVKEKSSKLKDIKQVDLDKTIKRTGQQSYGYANLEDLPSGFLLDNRYKIEAKIGSGGFGTVYKAWDNNMDCIKALKVIHSEYYDDKEVIADLKREAKLLMKIQSDKVVRLWDIHLTGEIKFIDMEYIDGGDLVDIKLSSPNKKVPETKVIELALQIIDGMQKIHKYNVIHKDLKPQNIMLTKEGTVKIMDFGISETFRSSMSRLKESSRSGTPAYMSPEQLIGKDVGRESDIWSFGVMLYELLTGKQLYTGQSYSDVLMQIERKKFEPIEGITKKTNKIIEKCLQYNYKERFRNFTEVEEFLLKKKKTETIDKPEMDKKKAEFLAKAEEIKPKAPKPIIVEKERLAKQKTLKNMIFVEGDTFQMGSNDGESNEKPVHTVTVSDFYIGKYEVTQKEWKEVMGNNPSYRKGDDLPVESISWYDAVEFCNKKSKAEGLAPCYTGSGKNTKCNFSANSYRLPTEAEWEYACRGGSRTAHYKYSGSNTIGDVAWYESNSGKNIHPVGTKKANELGIYDMSGNVWEWCNDWYGNYSSNSQTNPKGTDSGTSRVLRGSSWSASDCRVAIRFNNTPGSNVFRGFRIARTP